MRLSYTWLREFIDFPHSPEELSGILTGLGHTVDGIEAVGAKWTQVVVGKALECKPIAGSDHLKECYVTTGGAPLVSVCGAPNVAAGQTVPLALPGATLPGGFIVRERKMRGILSQGVICSERELGLSDDHKGILVLPNDLPLGAPLEQYLGLKDWIYDLDLTFSRPDCLSHLGIARDVAAKLRLPLRLPDIGSLAVETTNGRGAAQAAADYLTVNIESPEYCPRYSARLLRAVKIHPSPLWLQERLRNLGVRTISNVVDATNYVMLELGHPLHAFDYHLVAEGQIIVRKAAEDERFITLDEKEHTLTADDLLIADQQKGIALAGVMGGLNSEIKAD
ncbi:MAG: phenylalanine--tRNA ligase subunit beta, partial [Calditrichaeota bacterium]|nr:phenylalanine--tRNA ligase subunit beta [Calditrichota bacterium]